MLNIQLIGLKIKAEKEIRSTIEKALNIPIHLPQDLNIIEVYQRPVKFRGKYNPLTKKLILNAGYWCKTVLIHELLHATSYFSYPKYLELGRKIRTFIESMTEFIQGYITYKKFPTCYKAWINKKYKFCALTDMYELGTKTFAALARHVNISEITKLYIWNPEINWHDKYKEFLNKYNIEDIILSKKAKKIGIITTFINSLTKTFGNEIRELIYQALTETCLNYSEMKE